MPDLPPDLQDIVAYALKEDVAGGDITAALIPENKQARAVVLSRDEAVLCGAPWFEAVFQQLSDQTTMGLPPSTSSTSFLCQSPDGPQSCQVASLPWPR